MPDSAALRHGTPGDAGQTRRRLPIAAIYDGAGCIEAAALASVTDQMVCDWVEKFNAHGPERLINRKALPTSRTGSSASISPAKAY